MVDAAVSFSTLDETISSSFQLSSAKNQAHRLMVLTEHPRFLTTHARHTSMKGVANDIASLAPIRDLD
jgi:hypothetical protein